MNKMKPQEIKNQTYLAFHIGKYTISHYSNNSLWINADDGEGMEIDIIEFYKLIDDYYKENF